MIHGWVTKDMEKDVVSHSRFTIESKKQLNDICFLQGTNGEQGTDYLCAAGTNKEDGNAGVDIYEISRLSKEQAQGS